jgi:hypothetical protein
MAVSILLALFVLRAYVPAGFMPAAGAPFLLEVCPTGMPVAAGSPVAHHHMAGHDMAGHDMAGHAMGGHDSGGHSGFEDCPFGSAPATGPISQHIAPAPSAPIVSESILASEPAPAGTRLPRAHRARGPPALA